MKPKLSKEEFAKRIANIKLLALDVDGVLTDDAIYLGPDNFEMKRFNISDGFFMVLAMRSGLQIAIVSGRYSPATDSRMRDLGVKHVLQGNSDKVGLITPLLTELKLGFEQIAFVGNEILDIALAEKVGLSIAVSDSAVELTEVVDYVTAKEGGGGAVREVLEQYFVGSGLDPRKFIR